MAVGVIQDVLSRLKSRNVQTTGYDLFESIFQSQKNLTLKNLALETCANYIARAFSKGQFLIKKDGKRQKGNLDYLINVRPNPNQTASEFKSRLVYRYISNGEVLVIKDKKDNLYIADNFITHYSFSGNSYTGVTVNFDETNMTLAQNSQSPPQEFITQTFWQGINCFYIKNENDSLSGFIDNLWKDYGELFGTLIANQKKVGQLRAKIDMKVRNKLDDEERDRNGEFIEKTKTKLEKDSIVLIPTNGQNLTYDEVSSNKSASLQNQIADIDKLKQSYINDVSDILGIPNALMHGDMANNSENLDLFISVVLEPIANKLSESLMSLFIKQSGYNSNRLIVMVGFRDRDIFTLSDSIDKLTASGNFTRNEIRAELGYDPVEGGDIYVLTKNYQEGETNDD